MEVSIRILTLEYVKSGSRPAQKNIEQAYDGEEKREWINNKIMTKKRTIDIEKTQKIK
jgi:hypothetical protein